jgi:hypothetical protein
LGGCLLWEVYKEITEVARILVILFSMRQDDKNGLDYVLGNFFQNSSGHPVSKLKLLAQLYVKNRPRTKDAPDLSCIGNSLTELFCVYCGS